MVDLRYHLCYRFFEAEFKIGNYCFVRDIVDYLSRDHDLDLDNLVINFLFFFHWYVRKMEALKIGFSSTVIPIFFRRKFKSFHS